MSATIERTIRADDCSLRELNTELRRALANGESVRVADPMSRHNLGVALPAGGSVVFEGSVGYYCGGLNDGADITVTRNAGWGLGEAMASGTITVHGNAAMSIGASMRGGLIHVRGDAGPRCGVAMKGGTIIVEGSIGYSSAFMGYAGRVICFGDAADAAGDSLWGGQLWVAGEIGGLGVDARIEEPPAEEIDEVEAILQPLGLADAGRSWRRIVSAQQLWHFNSREAQQWLMI
jgi:methylamine---glutamate N-methyltransferase subunit B